MNSKLLVLATAAAACAFAQQSDVVHTTSGVQIMQFTPAQPAVAAPTQDHVYVMGGPGPMPMMERISLTPLKGAPYSAEAVTESVQTLADGNRITSKQSSKQYRDSEGRTRTENSIAPTALWVPENKGMTFITIMDPVSGESYTLNSAEKVATKMMIPKAFGVAGRKAAMRTNAGKTFDIQLDGAPGEAGVSGAMVTSDGGGPAVVTFQRHSTSIADDQNFKSEQLGKQVVEGVECIGVRETVTIPAGQIGNERPLEIVTERWGSPELGMDVLRKHSDPRSGETTYRLTNIVRGEQPRSLFEVPADYKLNDFSTENMRKKMTIKLRDPAPENQ